MVWQPNIRNMLWAPNAPPWTLSLDLDLSGELPSPRLPLPPYLQILAMPLFCGNPSVNKTWLQVACFWFNGPLQYAESENAVYFYRCSIVYLFEPCTKRQKRSRCRGAVSGTVPVGSGNHVLGGARGGWGDKSRTGTPIFAHEKYCQSLAYLIYLVHCVWQFVTCTSDFFTRNV